jgi:hypothetical protein
VVPELSNRAGKLKRQDVIMKNTATVLLCRDMTLRGKQMVLQLSLSKPGGHVLPPDFGQIRRWAISEDGLRRLHVEYLRSGLALGVWAKLPVYL